MRKIKEVLRLKWSRNPSNRRIASSCGIARPKVGEYRNCLGDQTSFIAWTIDALVACLMFNSDARWIRRIYARYLDLGRLSPH